MSVKRIAISLEPELLEKLEAATTRRVYKNRSKAVADILRDWFSREETARGKGQKIGTISIVYGHHTHGVLDRIMGIQHDSGASIISTLHVHLSHEECLEIIAIRGSAGQIQTLADGLASVRGVESCKLSIVK